MLFYKQIRNLKDKMGQFLLFLRSENKRCIEFCTNFRKFFNQPSVVSQTECKRIKGGQKNLSCQEKQCQRFLILSDCAISMDKAKIKFLFLMFLCFLNLEHPRFQFFQVFV